MARSLCHRHAISIQRPRAEVFHFLTHRVPELYRELNPGHERFDVVGGGPVRLDAVVDCSERAANQEVHHRYEVRAFEPDRHLYLASLPTRTLVRLKWRTIADTADTHVYYDLRDAPEGTLLDVTVVIQLRQRITQWLALLSGGSRVWKHHQRHEMGQMKRLIESGARSAHD